jgi:hypothetical protein
MPGLLMGSEKASFKARGLPPCLFYCVYRGYWLWYYFKAMKQVSLPKTVQAIAWNTADRVKRLTSLWWGGIGCRIAFIMSLAVVLVSALIGMFLLGEGTRSQEAEIRGRAYFIGNYVSSLAVDDITLENRPELYRKLMPSYLSPGYISRGLLYLRVHNRTGNLLDDSRPHGDRGGQFRARRISMPRA